VSLLSVSGVTKRFGGITANRDISFEVAAGELVGIIGTNRSGKSTLFEVVSGFYHPDEGAVSLDGARLTGHSPDHVCRLGVARTFQKLRPFWGLTVVDNVMVGALTRTLDVRHARARGLLARPRLLMIDEPFLGLAPMMVQEIGGLIRRIRDEQGISIVFIEQNVELALRLADRGYVLESGRAILSGPSAELLQSAEVKRIFFGDVAL
jgi:ABC-type branched-subunit amino acid transport system ATPase component